MLYETKLDGIFGSPLKNVFLLNRSFIKVKSMYTVIRLENSANVLESDVVCMALALAG
jgi:hypothetical protein